MAKSTNTTASKPGGDNTSGAAKSSLSKDVGLGAGVAVLFLLLRLFAVSGWNWQTAAAVVDTVNFDDAISIVFGTLFARPEVTSVLVMVLFPLSIVAILWPLSGHRRWQLSSVLTIATFGAVTVSLVSTMREWWLPAGMVIVAVVVIVLRRVWHSGAGHQVIAFLTRSIGWLALAAVLLLAVIVDTPWVVRERIVTQDETLDGYVMQVQPGFLKILKESNREFVIIESGSVRSRTITG